MGKTKPYAPELIEMMITHFVFARAPNPSDTALAESRLVAKSLLVEKPKWLTNTLTKYEREHPNGDEMTAMLDEVAGFLVAYARKTMPGLAAKEFSPYR